MLAMPTAGRLAAAIALGALGAYMASLMYPRLPGGTSVTYFWGLCIAAGLWAGWVVVGSRAGRGYVSATGNGLTGMMAMVFWVIFLLSFGDMIAKSMRRTYDGPVEAVVNVFEIMLDYGWLLYTNEIVLVLAGGAISVGLISEFFAKRYP